MGRDPEFELLCLRSQRPVPCAVQGHPSSVSLHKALHKRNTSGKEKGNSDHWEYVDPEDFILQADIQVLGSLTPCSEGEWEKAWEGVSGSRAGLE